MLRLRLLAAGFALSWAVLPTAQAVDPAVIEAENARAAVVEKVAPTVVAIFPPGGQGGGSGVLISADGYALSNFHVTSSCGNFMKCGLNDGKLYDAVIVGIDPTGDLALIKLLGRDDFPYATMGDSDAVKVGDWAYAMGNPFLLATDFHPTVTYGIVSGVHRYQYPAGTFLEYGDCIQVDSSINPGNSGGPLFSDTGELIGINGRGSFEKRGRVNVGAGYAISINQARHFLDHLRSGRIVDHATLGATVRTASDGTVVVDTVLESSDAWRRGLRNGDEIVSFAGRPIGSVNQFKNVLAIYPDGWTLPLVYRREGRKHEVFVQLARLHSQAELAEFSEKRPGMPERPDGQPREPEKDKPEEKPEGEPAPLPVPGHGAPTAQAPEEYKHMFVTKPGFANYYFNQLEQERILQGLASLGDFSAASARWRLKGKTGGGDTFTFTLADAGLGLELAGNVHFQSLGGTEFLDEPPGSGGLLLAMHHLRLLLTRRAVPFTEFYYLGSEPLDGAGDPVDVLVSDLTGVESRWYFRKSDGEFLGFDTRLSEADDACRVRFTSLGDYGERKLPNAFIVRSGDSEFARFQIEEVEFGSASGTREGNP